MPSNKKSKKGKNSMGEIKKRQVEFKEESQEYAVITKTLGNSRFHGDCLDGKTRLCILRNSMNYRKKRGKRRTGNDRVCVGDTVLVSLREYQDDKADIILKYSSDEVISLKNYGELPVTDDVGQEEEVVRIEPDIIIDDI